MTDETQAVLDRVRADLNRQVVPLFTDIRALLATVDALREDARRLDWLEAFAVRYPWVRVSMDSPGAWCLDNGHNTVAFDAPHVRAAIDAARVGGQP